MVTQRRLSSMTCKQKKGIKEMTKIKKIGKDGLEHEYWQLDEADKAKMKEQAEKRKAEIDRK